MPCCVLSLYFIVTCVHTSKSHYIIWNKYHSMHHIWVVLAARKALIIIVHCVKRKKIGPQLRGWVLGLRWNWDQNVHLNGVLNSRWIRTPLYGTITNESLRLLSTQITHSVQFSLRRQMDLCANFDRFKALVSCCTHYLPVTIIISYLSH